MKFLSDENIASSVVHALRKEGFDVLDIKEASLQGTSDNEILRIAEKEKRVILTHDKDFGSVLQRPLKHQGIILLRFFNQKPDNVEKHLMRILSSQLSDKLEGNLVIISETKMTVHKSA